MRSLLTTSFLCISSLAFSNVLSLNGPTEGTNQSYLLFDNGEVSTTRSYYPSDKEIKVIDADHMFLLPRNVYKTAANYILDKDGEIYTMDAHGYIYHKEFYYRDSSIRYFGGNYFVTKKGQFHIVKNDGIVFSYDGIESDSVKKLALVGGNYFITKRGNLFVVTDNGYYFNKTDLKDFKSNQVKIKGNNYLITKKGVVYTFGTEYVKEVDANGSLTNKPLLDANGNKQYYAVVYKYSSTPFKSISKVGGNYFFDSENNIHTISNNGVLDRGIVNRKLKIHLNEDKDRSAELPVEFGNNYFIYNDGAMYTVDRDGYFYYLKTLERRVSRTNFEHKLNKKNKN